MLDLKYIKKKSSVTSEFFVSGCDEVGRGPLAGPVVAACALLDIKSFNEIEIKTILKTWKQWGVSDSKKLTGKERKEILEKFNIDFLMPKQLLKYHYSKNISLHLSLQEISPARIDEINILQASLLAMKEAAIVCTPQDKSGIILIDGNKIFKNEDSKIELNAIIKGDSKSLLIGLASIVAKEYRDQLMQNLDEIYPGYGWNQNSGYPTKSHLKAISELGVTEHHRLTFKGVKEIYAERGLR